MYKAWLAALNPACAVVILRLALLAFQAPAEANPAVVYDFAGEWGYARAAAEFRSYVSRISGENWDLLDDNDPGLAARTQLVIIGDGGANAVASSLEGSGAVDFSVLPAMGDGFLTKSVAHDGTNYLVLAGRKGHSTLYAVYDYFERFCGVGYFMDEDSVPAGAAMPMTGVDVLEVPCFQYRQLNPASGHHRHTRYLSHSWKLADWQKFIDQAVKRKVNPMPYDTSIYNTEVLGDVYEEATGRFVAAD